MKYVGWFIAAVALIDLGSFLVYFTASPTGPVRGYFYYEDSLVENATALVFLGAFIFAAALLVAGNIQAKFHRNWLVLTGGLGLLGFLDEISFGERLFSLKMPKIGGVKIDAVHDLVDLAISQTQPAVFVALGFIVLLIGVFRLKHVNRIWAAAVAQNNHPLLVLLFLMATFLVSALLLDSGLVWIVGNVAIEELLELNAAMALLASGLTVYGLNSVARLHRRELHQHSIYTQV